MRTAPAWTSGSRPGSCGAAGRGSRARAGRARAEGSGEVVLIMGLPGAGKSTVAESFVAQGYERLNRDEAADRCGGCCRRSIAYRSGCFTHRPRQHVCVPKVARGRDSGSVASEAFPSDASGSPPKLEDAQVNAAWRIVSSYGRLLGPEEIRGASKQDIAAFGPAVQFRYQRELEPPDSV